MKKGGKIIGGKERRGRDSAVPCQMLRKEEERRKKGGRKKEERGKKEGRKEQERRKK